MDSIAPTSGGQYHWYALHDERRGWIGEMKGRRC